MAPKVRQNAVPDVSTLLKEELVERVTNRDSSGYLAVEHANFKRIGDGSRTQIATCTFVFEQAEVSGKVLPRLVAEGKSVVFTRHGTLGLVEPLGVSQL